MNRTIACRRLATSVVRLPCRKAIQSPLSLQQTSRSLSTSTPRQSETSRKLLESLQAVASRPPKRDGTTANTMQDLSALLVKQATAMGLGPPSSSSTSASGAAGGAGSAAGSTLLNPAAAASGDGTADGGIGNLLSAAASVARRHHPSMAPTSAYENEPYHIHVYSHKHNTHVTVTKPNGDAILSMSNGGLGFKKSKRKTFDAAFQLSSFVLSRMTQEGWDRKINAIEVVLRGFGQGREAMTKALLGPEGRAFRDKIIRVSDATRLKIGGCRSRKPRRL